MSMVARAARTGSGVPALELGTREENISSRQRYTNQSPEGNTTERKDSLVDDTSWIIVDNEQAMSII